MGTQPAQPVGAAAPSAILPASSRRWWSLTGRLVLWAGSGVTWLVTGVLLLISPLFLLNDASNASAQVGAGFELVLAMVGVSVGCGVMVATARRNPWIRVGLMVAGWALAGLFLLHLRALQHAA